MQGAKSKSFQTSDDVRLHYLEAGAGPAIIFVPGWTVPAEIWRLQLEHLARKFRIVLLDPRSQGESEKTQKNAPERRAQDLAELIAEVGDGPVALVGWSWGAVEVLHYIDLFGPEAIIGAVLIDVFFLLPDWIEGEVRRMSSDLKADPAGAIGSYVRGMYKTPQEDNYIAGMVHACLRTPTDIAIALMEDFLKRTDWTPVLKKIDKPLLYVAQEGLRDQAELLKKIMPGAETAIFEAAGHALFVDEASRFNSILEHFLESRCQAKMCADAQNM